ncbi:MAG: hypothetical protein QGI19_09730, partial [Thalassolituus sp.]|nr:hypothetical protein [Thalassolituus sp.]
MEFKKSLLTTLILSFALTGCGGDDNSSNNDNSSDVVDDVTDTSDAPTAPEETLEFYESLAAEGVYLPYSVLRSDLIDNKTSLPFEVRNGGFGSAMFKDPQSDNRFYA